MRFPLTTRARLTRCTLGLVFAATLAITAHGGPTTHASPSLHAPVAVITSPHISVNDELWGPNNPRVLPVTGSNFTVNSPVLLEVVNSSGAILTTAVTTVGGAALANSPRAGTFRYGLIIPEPYRLPGLRLFAIDEATSGRSNTIAFHYPIPSCIHHPYTCV